MYLGVTEKPIERVGNDACRTRGRILTLRLHRHSIFVPIIMESASTIDVGVGDSETWGEGKGMGWSTSSMLRTGQYSKSSSKSNDLAAS